MGICASFRNGGGGSVGGEDGVVRGLCVEATGWAFDLAHAEKVVEGALDLGGG